MDLYSVGEGTDRGPVPCRLQVTAELALRDCTKLKYSPSGHLAAAATPRELTVYSALDWTPLAAFKVSAPPGQPCGPLIWGRLVPRRAELHGAGSQNSSPREVRVTMPQGSQQEVFALLQSAPCQELRYSMPPAQEARTGSHIRIGTASYTTFDLSVPH